MSGDGNCLFRSVAQGASTDAQTPFGSYGSILLNGLMTGSRPSILAPEQHHGTMARSFRDAASSHRHPAALEPKPSTRAWQKAKVVDLPRPGSAHPEPPRP